MNNRKVTVDVVFLGGADKVPDVLQGMEGMVFPSRYEGLPLTVVEWQMAGLPCFVSDTVAAECAFTDLVRFVSLDEPEKVWAGQIAAVDRGQRETNADRYITLAAEHGYDLKANAKELEEYLAGAKLKEQGTGRKR